MVTKKIPKIKKKNEQKKKSKKTKEVFSHIKKSKIKINKHSEVGQSNQKKTNHQNNKHIWETKKHTKTAQG